MTFGEYLTQLRNARKLPKNALARELGTTFSTVNSWELHGAAPSQSNMQDLIDKLGLTAAEKTKLMELWLAMPRARKRGVEEHAPRYVSPPPDPKVSAASASALELLLTQALVPGQHTLSDAHAVLKVLAEGAPVLQAVSVSPERARAWLDAAKTLREQDLKLTAAGLLIMVSAE
jgi:transcriptional regulator with XRE-family HTH domain